MQYLNNLLDVVPVHLFTASPLTSQQMVFIHPSTTTEFACTFFTNKVALPCSTPQMVQTRCSATCPCSGVCDCYQNGIDWVFSPTTNELIRAPCRSWQNTISDARFHLIASRSALVEHNFDTPNQAFMSLPCTTSK